MSAFDVKHKGRYARAVGCATDPKNAPEIASSEPRAPANGPQDGGMLSPDERRAAAQRRHAACATPEIARLEWFTSRRWKPQEGGAVAVMLAMGLEPPFIVTADDFEEIAFLLRSEGRRKAARSLKLLADKGIVASLPKHVFKLARAFNTVSPAVRAKIFERDKVCRLCGAEHGLTIDHITARCLGGENVEENLQVLCLTCNTRKAVEERREAARRANA